MTRTGRTLTLLALFLFLVTLTADASSHPMSANGALAGLDTATVTTHTAAPRAAPLADPIRSSIGKRGVEISLAPVASGLTAPVWAVAAPGVDPKFLFTVDQAGILWRIDVTTGTKIVFLDVTSRLVPLGVGGPGTFDERGFLGVAFDPAYTSNGRLYTYTSEVALPGPDFSTMPPATSPDHQSLVIEWQVPSPTDPGAVVDPGSARVLLRIDEPQFNHDGGCLNFGADGMLYISLGDGGGADDEDGPPFIGGPLVGHGPGGNGQDLGAVLGKILRIDPQGSNAANGQYGIPSDNPFVAQPGVVEEIWAYGFRNPFRHSFDPVTGALYVGDVGQNDIEEVDVVVAGGNYGWRLKEGRFFFDPNGTGPGFVTRRKSGVPGGLLQPSAQYDHDEGLAVIGGFVYRGTQIPRLIGRYVFGEFAQTFNNDGRLFHLRRRELVRNRIRRSRPLEFRIVGQATLGLSLLGLGQDAAGELYVLANSTGVPSGTTGVVVRIAPPP